MRTMTETAKKKRGMPSSFTILLLLLAIVAVITVVVSGASGGAVTAARLSDFFTAPVKGFADALPVCLFVMILGGFLGMMTETGALDNGIAVLVKKLKGHEIWIIPVLMGIFALGGTSYGMCEETVPFYALLAATMMAAGFDPLVGAATVLLGAGCGCLGSTVNPFAVGAAVDALSSKGIEVDQTVIIGLGILLTVVTTVISAIFVMCYAKKVKADKGSTILSMQELKDAEEAHGAAAAEVTKDVKLTGRQKAVLGIFTFTFAVMIVGFIPLADLNAGVAGFFDNGVYDAEGNVITQAWSAVITGLPIGQWYFDEASTWFFIMAIVIGILGGLRENEIVDGFLDGAADMIGVALMVGLSRAISILMGETGLDMVILNNASAALEGTSALAFGPISYLVYLGLSVVITSTSALATISMPILGPLAANLGFPPEVIITIFCAANGLANLFSPTAVFLPGLLLARVQYPTWLKWALAPIVVIAVASVAICTVALMVL